MFKDKTLLITGGTGSFGNAVLKRFLNIDLENSKRFTDELKVKNVVFSGRKSIDEMLSLTLAGKNQSYMSAGKSILGAINGETQSIIADAGCGFVGATDNA